MSTVMWKKKSESSPKEYKKEKIIAGAGALIILICGLAGFTFTAQSSVQSSGHNAEITAGRDEELIYARITSVIGNEITCAVDSSEEKSYQIPVGTTVTTRLGAVTTFAKLAEGNSVAILLQKDTDNIRKIWIVQ